MSPCILREAALPEAATVMLTEAELARRKAAATGIQTGAETAT